MKFWSVYNYVGGFIIRSPIVCLLGHVDHGKTSILDRTRGTAIAEKEAGGITQMIGASFIPIQTVNRICKKIIESMRISLTIPGILIIDTPGHEAFTNLRRRGGSIADVAVLVVDVTQGFQAQTREAIEILREYKTPFILAANKIDLINGWKPTNISSFSSAIKLQSPNVSLELDEKIYSLIGSLHSEFGFCSERFDRIGDFSKTVCVVPLSAKTGEGIAELLLFLAGLSQKYLEERLKIDVKGEGKGSILEVKEESGLGTTIDVILYDGRIKKRDVIVFGKLDGPASTRVRAILKPKPLSEGAHKERFSYVDEAYAACGIKIFAPNLQGAVPGSPLFVANKNEEMLKKEVYKEICDILVDTGTAGVILKADTLGSVEAITRLLSSSNVPIKRAGIGIVTKRDVIDACAVKSENKYIGVILAFNAKTAPDALLEAEKNRIQIISGNIIYSLLEEYNKWVEKEREIEKKEVFSTLILPVKIKVLPNCCFRANKPAIFGVKILAGRLKPKYKLINIDGEVVGEVKSIQKEKASQEEAGEGMEVAISMDEPIFGRNINEGDILYSLIPKEHARLLIEKYKEFLSENEVKLIDEISALRQVFSSRKTKLSL